MTKIKKKKKHSVLCAICRNNPVQVKFYAWLDCSSTDYRRNCDMNVELLSSLHVAIQTGIVY